MRRGATSARSTPSLRPISTVTAASCAVRGAAPSSLMQRLARTLSLIAAVSGGAAAVVVLSRVLLTLDELQSRELRLAYGLGIVAIAAVGLFVARRAIRGPRPPRAQKQRQAIRKTPESRLDRLFAKHGLEIDPRDTALRTKRPDRGEPARIAVVGVGRTGKSRIAAALAALLPEEDGLQPFEIVEIPSLGSDFAANLEALTPALAAHVVLFVADQDLRDYEFAALKALVERGAAPIVVLNKSDQRNAAARAETMRAVVHRLGDLVAADDIVEAAADPLPAVRVARDAGGRTVETEVARPADVVPVAALVARRLRR